MCMKFRQYKYGFIEPISWAKISFAWPVPKWSFQYRSLMSKQILPTMYSFSYTAHQFPSQLYINFMKFHRIFFFLLSRVCSILITVCFWSAGCRETSGGTESRNEWVSPDEGSHWYKFFQASKRKLGLGLFLTPRLLFY